MANISHFLMFHVGIERPLFRHVLGLRALTAVPDCSYDF